MQRPEDAHLWMKRSLSNLEKAKQGRISDLVLYEDLCFDVQQSVEKALKAVCIFNGIIFLKTHDISYLIELLDANGIEVNDIVRSAKYITQFAVETRYPGIYDPVTQEEYENALSICERTFVWASKMTSFDQ